MASKRGKNKKVAHEASVSLTLNMYLQPIRLSLFYCELDGRNKSVLSTCTVLVANKFFLNTFKNNWLYYSRPITTQDVLKVKRLEF